MKLTREQVYKIIDSERDYQNHLSKEKGYDDNHSTAEHLVLLRSYLNRAETAWCDNLGDDMALEGIRKIAGIAVRCMEENGGKPR